MIKSLENRFYYLENFTTALNSIVARYADILSCQEREFVVSFHQLPEATKALLVRMVMRKGSLFRSGKLVYEEIGSAEHAAAPLVALGWVDNNPLLGVEELFGLLKKAEISQVFGPSLYNKGARKSDQLLALGEITDRRTFAAWYPASPECLYQVHITQTCDRLRLMFFGNLRQDWSEFVLADLGIFQYEKVEFSASSRGFRTRQDIDDYQHLHSCRERFLQGEHPEEIRKNIPARAYANDWLEGRRTKLLFQIGQHYEQIKEFPAALNIYAQCNYPGSRIRAIRIMERSAQFESALSLAKIAEHMPESEPETQQLLRILPRLYRKLGHAKVPVLRPAAASRMDMVLPKPEALISVEESVRGHLELDSLPQSARVYYVENALINSLFGLLCWNVVFLPISGAFFHPFHTGPADLHSPDFYSRRKSHFIDSLLQLDSEQYVHTIRQNFREKAGIQSPFVFWGILTEELLDLALSCVPALHLKRWFERILLDIKSNRAGMPDLIQFWPNEKRYRMIEVKGPGDRLQDNQVRWLDYYAQHDMPVTVCHVQWAKEAE